MDMDPGCFAFRDLHPAEPFSQDFGPGCTNRATQKLPREEQEADCGRGQNVVEQEHGQAPGGR